MKAAGRIQAIAEERQSTIVIPGYTLIKQGKSPAWQAPIWGPLATETTWAGEQPCPAWACQEG